MLRVYIKHYGSVHYIRLMTSSLLMHRGSYKPGESLPDMHDPSKESKPWWKKCFSKACVTPSGWFEWCKVPGKPASARPGGSPPVASPSDVKDPRVDSSLPLRILNSASNNASDIPDGYELESNLSAMEKWSYYFKSGNRQTYSFLEQNSAETRYIRAATGSIPRGMKFGTESHTFLDADECCSWIVISQYRFARGVRDYTILF